MNMEEYFRALETYVASRKLNLGDGDSVLSLLYEHTVIAIGCMMTKSRLILQNCIRY